jgi:hypothetical protein
MLSRIVTTALTGLLIVALVACPGQTDVKTGKVKVTLQDAPFGAEKVEVTISEVAVHFVPKGKDAKAGDEAAADTGDDPAKAGWRAVLSKETTFDLLKLKDNPTTLGELDLAEGKITQIRLYLAEGKAPTITVAGKTSEMKVPSGKVKIVGNFDVVPGSETPIKLDFDVEASLKQKGGGYSMRPTVKLIK